MILITGLTGTSGSAFYDVLCRERYPEKIRVVVRRSTDLSMFENSPLDLEFVTGDVGSEAFMVSAMQGCDTVFHIARKEKGDVVANAAVKAQVKWVILVSSTIVYSAFHPNSKLNRFEPAIREKLREEGIRYVFLRPTMIFGTPDDRNISVFIRWFMKYPVFPIVKHGAATIRPVCRLDLAEAFWKVLVNRESLRRDDYVISGRDEMTLKEMFGIITDVLGKKVWFVNIPFGAAKMCVQAVYRLSGKRIDYREKLDRLAEDRAYDHAEFSGELGFEPRSFRERVEPLVRQIQEKR